MKKKLIFCISLILSILICISSMQISAITYDNDINITSKAVLVANLDTDTFVYEKNADTARFQSYLTHIMTFIIAANNVVDLDEPVVIKQEVLDMVPYTDNTLSKYVNSSLTVYDLLCFLMLPNGTDAAYVLADYVSGGDIDAFVDLMNKKAKELGCKKTRFASPSLVMDATQFTTCSDMYKIVKNALQIPEYVEISGMYTYTPSDYKESKNYTIASKDSLINNESPYYFRYAVNGKYGADRVGLGNLVSVSVYNDVTYVCIVSGAQVVSEHNAFTEAKQLFSWAYQNLGNKQIVAEDDVLKSVSVDTMWGESVIQLNTGEDIVRTVPADFSYDKLEYKYKISKKLKLPVFKGQNLGSAKMYYDGEYFDTIELISNESVGTSMYSDISSFLGVMFDATLVDASDSDKTEQTQQPTQKQTPTQADATASTQAG